MEKDKYLTLVELLLNRSESQPHEIAYTFLKDGETDSYSITYQQLDEQAKAMASRLQQMNFANSRAILIYSYDAGLEFMAAFFGCLYANVIAVSCHQPRNQGGIEDVRGRLISSEAKVILTQKSLLAKLKTQLASIEPQPIWLTAEEISIYEADAWNQPQITGDTLAFLQYTSGSTGLPKGVKITHECLLYTQAMLKVAFNHSEASIGVGWLPLFHDMGLIGNGLQALYLGRPCIFMSPIAFVQKPARWLQAISRYGATTSGGPNFAYDLLIAHVSEAQAENLDLSNWSVAFSGAESVRSATIDKFVEKFAPYGFRREAFYPCYGMAEATLLIAGGKQSAAPVVKYVDESALAENRVIVSDRSQDGFRAIVGCGQPWLDGEIVIADPQSLKECPANKVGEIWASGSGIGKGYWGEPEKTATTFLAYLNNNKKNPYLRTGDLGFIQDGELFITGRLKEILVFLGLNHYPQHIEQTVQKCHPGFRQNMGAAFAVEIGGEDRLVVIQEVDRTYQKTLAIDDVVEPIRWQIFEEHLVDVYAIALIKMGSIPKTSSGKIQRHLCRAKFLDGSLDILSEWRSPDAEAKDITSIIQKYFHPLIHLKRYGILARRKVRQIWQSWRSK
jgi:acyl-CoA synthetase (AMP-forming)/AMP-acid ligase II